MHRFAFYRAASYLLVCGLYIMISGDVALQIAQSPLQRAGFKLWKGLAFVDITLILFYFMAWTLVNRILRQQNALTEQGRAWLEMETIPSEGTMAASVAHDIKKIS